MGGIGIPIPPIIILALCALRPPAPIFPVCFGVGRLRCPKSPKSPEARKAGKLPGFSGFRAFTAKILQPFIIF